MDSTSFPPPTADERLMALLAHILQIFSWFIGPLVILLVKRDSRFVKFHATQALIWQIVLMITGMCGMVFFFLFMFLTISTQAHNAHANAPPAGFFLGFAAIWLLWMGMMALNLVLSIVYGIKAHNGEWAQYPLIGRLAWRLL